MKGSRVYYDFKFKIRNRLVGYFRDEHTEAYFDGLTINVNQKGFQRALK